MSHINPLGHSLLGALNQQRLLSINKTQHARQARELEKQIEDQDDVLEHEVEESEEDPDLLDEQPQPKKQNKRNPKDAPDNQKPHLDITG